MSTSATAIGAHLSQANAVRIDSISTKTLRPQPERCQVIEEKLSAPTLRSLINISELTGFKPDQFNTLEGQPTREVTIVGFALRWDGSVDLLEAYRATQDV